MHYQLYFFLFYLWSTLIYGFYLPINHRSLIRDKISFPIVSHFDVKPKENVQNKPLRFTLPRFQVQPKDVTRESIASTVLIQKYITSSTASFQTNRQTFDEQELDLDEIVTEISKDANTNFESELIIGDQQTASATVEPFEELSTSPVEEPIEINQPVEHKFDLNENITEIHEKLITTETEPFTPFYYTQTLNELVQDQLDLFDDVTEIIENQNMFESTVSQSSFIELSQNATESLEELVQHNLDLNKNTTFESAPITKIEEITTSQEVTQETEILEHLFTTTEPVHSSEIQQSTFFTFPPFPPHKISTIPFIELLQNDTLAVNELVPPKLDLNEDLTENFEDSNVTSESTLIANIEQITALPEVFSTPFIKLLQNNTEIFENTSTSLSFEIEQITDLSYNRSTLSSVEETFHFNTETFSEFVQLDLGENVTEKTNYSNATPDLKPTTDLEPLMPNPTSLLETLSTSVVESSELNNSTINEFATHEFDVNKSVSEIPNNNNATVESEHSTDIKPTSVSPTSIEEPLETNVSTLNESAAEMLENINVTELIVDLESNTNTESDSATFSSLETISVSSISSEELLETNSQPLNESVTEMLKDNNVTEMPVDLESKPDTENDLATFSSLEIEPETTISPIPSEEPIDTTIYPIPSEEPLDTTISSIPSEELLETTISLIPSEELLETTISLIPSEEPLDTTISPIPSEEPLDTTISPIPSEEPLDTTISPIPSEEPLDTTISPIPSEEPLDTTISPIPSEEPLDTTISPIPSEEPLETNAQTFNESVSEIFQDINVTEIPVNLESKPNTENDLATFSSLEIEPEISVSTTPIEDSLETTVQIFNKNVTEMFTDLNVTKMPGDIEVKPNTENNFTFIFEIDPEISVSTTSIEDSLETDAPTLNENATEIFKNSNVTEIPVDLESKPNNESNFATFSSLETSSVSTTPIEESLKTDVPSFNEDITEIFNDSNVTEILGDIESNTESNSVTFSSLETINVSPTSLATIGQTLNEKVTEIFNNVTEISENLNATLVSMLYTESNSVTLLNNFSQSSLEKLLESNTQALNESVEDLNSNFNVTEMFKDSTTIENLNSTLEFMDTTENNPVTISTISSINVETSLPLEPNENITQTLSEIVTEMYKETKESIESMLSTKSEANTFDVLSTQSVEPLKINTLNESVQYQLDVNENVTIVPDNSNEILSQVEQVKPRLYQPEVEITKGKWPKAPPPDPNLPFPPEVQALAYKLNFSDLSELNHSYNYADNYGYLSYVKDNVKARSKREVMDPEEDHEESYDIADIFTASLRLYQNFVGLSNTGKLDQATVSKMKKPRCGNRDLGMEKTHQQSLYGPNGSMQRKLKRSKRYAIEGSRWKRAKTVTYCLTKYPDRAIKRKVTSLVLGEIVKAMETWNKQLPFQLEHIDCFDHVTGRQKQWAEIDLRFAFGAHGDGDDFDGPGGILAHGYFPEFGGDVHFDESEHWTNTGQGSNLFIVALHEIGHALGLDHSANLHSIMQPIYPPWRPGITLDKDDIEGVQLIYQNSS